LIKFGQLLAHFDQIWSILVHFLLFFLSISATFGHFSHIFVNFRPILIKFHRFSSIISLCLLILVDFGYYLVNFRKFGSYFGHFLVNYWSSFANLCRLFVHFDQIWSVLVDF